MNEFLVVLILIFCVNLYFWPTKKAYKKGRKDRIWVFWINLFIGWTVLGWFGCLVWVEQNDE